jgi:hypothetical protein
VTPTLSEDALQFRVRPVWLTLDAASPAGVDGGVVSGQAVVATIVVDLAERLPAAS